MCCSLSSLHQTPYCVCYWLFNPGIPFSERRFHFSSCLLVSNKRLSATVLWIANEMWVQINYGCMLIRDQRQKRQMRSSRLSPMGLCRILVIIFSLCFLCSSFTYCPLRKFTAFPQRQSCRAVYYQEDFLSTFLKFLFPHFCSILSI